MVVRNKIYFVFLLISIACKQNLTPEEIFEHTKNKYLTSEYIAYKSVLYWPHPLLHEVDTVRLELKFQKNPNKFYDFNYVVMSEEIGHVYIDEVYSRISHSDSTVHAYSEEEMEQRSEMISDNMFTSFSPIKLLEDGPYSYKQDSLICGVLLKNYYYNSMDTVIEDKKILLEKHIFIREDKHEIPLIMTKHYLNGEENQIIDVWFDEISFKAENQHLSYLPPSTYKSIVGDDIEKINLVKEGSKAPDFSLGDMEGSLVNLADFKGKKVLLDFSMINCGWCKHAIDKFNTPDFEFKSNLVPLYINPVDKKDRMSKYLLIIEIGFPVLAEAKETGLSYGVNSYPTFILIDENGIIEKTFVGFSEDMISMIGKMN